MSWEFEVGWLVYMDESVNFKERVKQKRKSKTKEIQVLKIYLTPSSPCSIPLCTL